MIRQQTMLGGVFKDNIDMARCSGQIVKVNQNTAQVRWDMDGKITTTKLEWLEKDVGRSLNDTRSDDDKNKGRLAKQYLKIHNFKFKIRTTALILSIFMNLGSKSESNLNQELSASDSSLQLLSESDSETSDKNPKVVTAHNTVWKFGVACTNCR